MISLCITLTLPGVRAVLTAGCRYTHCWYLLRQTAGAMALHYPAAACFSAAAADLSPARLLATVLAETKPDRSGAGQRRGAQAAGARMLCCATLRLWFVTGTAPAAKNISGDCGRAGSRWHRDTSLASAARMQRHLYILFERRAANGEPPYSICGSASLTPRVGILAAGAHVTAAPFLLAWPLLATAGISTFTVCRGICGRLFAATTHTLNSGDSAAMVRGSLQEKTAIALTRKHAILDCRGLVVLLHFAMRRMTAACAQPFSIFAYPQWLKTWRPDGLYARDMFGCCRTFVLVTVASS